MKRMKPTKPADEFTDHEAVKARETRAGRRGQISPLARAALMLGVDFDDVEAYVCRPRERLEYLAELAGAES